MKTKLLVLLATISLAVPLTACNTFFPDFNISTNQTSRVKDLENSFVNSIDGKTKYVSLDEQHLTLIPGYTHQFGVAIYEAGEQPKVQNWENISWGSENNEIASIDENGYMTANGVGTTRIFAKVFTGVGAYCTVSVVKKELESISLKNAKKTYILDSEFSPALTLVAKYVGGIEEVVTPTSVDYSAVNMAVEGTYPVKVTYTFEDVTKEISYDIKVVDNPTYEAKNLSYTYNNLYREREYGWYCPHTGDIKGLVIPIYFTDSGKYIGDKTSEVITDLRKAFYGEAGEDGWNSVKSYYYEVSNHTLNINGTVSDWYEPGYPSTSVNNSERINKLVKDAVDWYFSEHPEEDMRSYDSDSNGVFDSLNIIYGRPDYDEKGIDKDRPEASLYWGKISAQSTPIVKGEGGNPDIKFHMWASFESLYEDDGLDADSHVFIHETGHTFGLADYYDYGETYRAMSGGTMMFHNTHEQDPFSTLSLGWSKVIVPETSCTIELGDYQSSHQSILLSPNPETVDSPFDEYILVELYAPNGVNRYDTENKWKGFYSTGPLEAGIRLWHVDARLIEKVADGWRFTDNIETSNLSEPAFTNSWGDNHGTSLGREYDDYSLLFDIRNDKEISYHPTTEDKNCMVSDETLFHDGDVFTISDYSSQFVNGDKLNSGKDFPWKIIVESINADGDGYKATINLEFND